MRQIASHFFASWCSCWLAAGCRLSPGLAYTTFADETGATVQGGYENQASLAGARTTPLTTGPSR